MKAILISIKPRHNKNILNEIKTLEIRKKFPKDYVGWVYIYNTKDFKDGYLTCAYIGNKLEFITSFSEHKKYRGKVIARFWCDKVEEIKYHFGYYDMGEWTESYILENACLTAEELDNYLQASKEYDEKKVSRVYGYGIHITKLEIFTKPKEISEFKRCQLLWCCEPHDCEKCRHALPLTCAPQSWCYVEVDQ